MSKISKTISQGQNNLILKRPRITEKSTKLSETDRPIYVFEVDSSANKHLVNLAIQEIYKVKPVKINVVNVKPKRVFNRGKWGKTSSFKKAVVYLKRGDKIEFV